MKSRQPPHNGNPMTFNFMSLKLRQNRKVQHDHDTIACTGAGNDGLIGIAIMKGPMVTIITSYYIQRQIHDRFTTGPS
jgi:hypothetical protein